MTALESELFRLRQENAELRLKDVAKTRLLVQQAERMAQLRAELRAARGQDIDPRRFEGWLYQLGGVWQGPLVSGDTAAIALRLLFERETGAALLVCPRGVDPNVEILQ